jgi:hypothetical protein
MSRKMLRRLLVSGALIIAFLALIRHQYQAPPASLLRPDQTLDTANIQSHALTKAVAAHTAPPIQSPTKNSAVKRVKLMP